MLRILHDTNYDFIRWWKVMAAITIAFIVLGLGSLAIKPLNLSIEFTGGTLMQLEFTKPPDVAAIRSTLDEAGIRGAEIQQFGTNREFTVRAQDPAAVAAQSRGAESIAVTIERVLKQNGSRRAPSRKRAEARGDHCDPAVVPHYTRLPVDPVRVAIRHRRRHRDQSRRFHHNRVSQADASGDFADCRGRSADCSGVLPE
jgi:hypothetical protein